MGKVFLDTNFLIDVAMESRPGSEAAARLFEAAAGGEVSCLVAASSLKDFYYITRRGFSDEIRREWIALFFDVFTIANMGAAEVASALNGGEPNFEDGLILAVAQLSGCSCIISRDERAFASSSLPRLSSEEYLESVTLG